MATHQPKSTVTTKDNLPPPYNNLTQPPYTVSPGKCNIIEAQDKDFKIATVNMFKNLKEETHE